MTTSGIYKIENIITNKCYIGSAINLTKRKNNHFYLLKLNKHHSAKLQNSFNKHGINNFIFTILEKCNKQALITKEQEYIDKLKPCYNIAQCAHSRLNLKASDYTKNLLKEATLKNWKDADKRNAMLKNRVYGKLSEEHKNKISKACFGKKRSMEACKNISIGKLGKTATIIAKHNISISHKGKEKPYVRKGVRLVDITTNCVYYFNDVQEASSIVNVKKDTLRQGLYKSKKIINKKYNIEYI